MHRNLDSRESLGSDIHRGTPQRPLETSFEASTYTGDCRVIRFVRVVVGYLGDVVRVSAAELGIVADGHSVESGWDAFLDMVSLRSDASWLAFDVGPTRTHEVDGGLDAEEDEDWSQSIVESGGE